MELLQFRMDHLHSVLSAPLWVISVLCNLLEFKRRQNIQSSLAYFFLVWTCSIQVILLPSSSTFFNLHKKQIRSTSQQLREELRRKDRVLMGLHVNLVRFESLE